MAAQSWHGFRPAPGSTAWGRAWRVGLAAVPIQVSSTELMWSRLCYVRRRQGRPNVRPWNGTTCPARAGRPRSLARLQRTRGSSMSGEANYSPISTRESNRDGLTWLVLRGILQTYWESAHDGMLRCNARMALRVKRKWRIVWWCMLSSISLSPQTSTSRLPQALPPRRCNFWGETRA